MAKSYIIDFLHSLSKSEIQIAQQHLKHSSTNTENIHEKKDITLFNLLLANKNAKLTDKQLCEMLNCSKGALHVQKSRLYQTILEAITLEKHVTNTAIFGDYDITSFTLKKKLLAFKVLLRSQNQGKIKVLYELLNEIINTAKEYQLYEILVEALTAKKYFNGLRSGIKEFENINQELEFYDYCLKATLNANDHFYRVILNNDFINSFSKKELKIYIEKCIKQMEFDYKKTKSEQINYYLQIIYSAKCEQEKKYILAINYWNKVLFLLKKSKIIYRRERVGFALDNICQFKIYLGNYESAALDAKKAQDYYIKYCFESIMSKEQELYAYIYGGNMHKALNCTEELLEHSLIDTGTFRKSKYIYYQACVLFALKDYKGALALLKTSLEIEKDKTRWNISLRILNIMLFIELNKIDEAASSLESLRKYMERTAKGDEVKARDVLIVKLLREMEKDGFNYNPKNPSVTTMLKALSEKDKPVSWEHYTSELIPFHTWLEGKKSSKLQAAN